MGVTVFKKKKKEQGQVTAINLIRSDLKARCLVCNSKFLQRLTFKYLLTEVTLKTTRSYIPNMKYLFDQWLLYQEKLCISAVREKMWDNHWFIYDVDTDVLVPWKVFKIWMLNISDGCTYSTFVKLLFGTQVLQENACGHWITERMFELVISIVNQTYLFHSVIWLELAVASLGLPIHFCWK